MRRDGVSETRRTICQAALRLFVEQGIGATSVENILEASGMSVGSFYYLFKNKLDLAVTLFLEMQEQLACQMLAELSHYQQARAGIEALVRFFLHWATDHPVEMAYLVWFREREILQLPRPEQARVLATTFTQQLTLWLQSYMAEGTLRKLTPEQALVLWFGPANGLVQHALGAFGIFSTCPHPQVQELLQNSADLLAEQAWQGLKG